MCTPYSSFMIVMLSIYTAPDVSPVFESLATRVELEDTISITIMFRVSENSVTYNVSLCV